MDRPFSTAPRFSGRLGVLFFCVLLVLGFIGCASKKYQHKSGQNRKGPKSLRQAIIDGEKRRQALEQRDPVLKQSSKYFNIQGKLAVPLFKAKAKKWVGESSNGLIRPTPWVPKKKELRSRLNRLVQRENEARKRIFAIHRKGDKMNRQMYKQFITAYFEQMREQGPTGTPYFLNGQWFR